MKPHLFALVTCLTATLATAATAATAGSGPDLLAPGEVHLSDLRQLTFGGENAEAYWSPDGSELVMQSTRPPYGCDQIFRLPVDPPGELRLVSTGTGRTTCAYFTFPAGERILFASTHHASEACPAPPEMSQGYVWALYPEYELYSARPDGSELVRLTDNGVYDAEATVCQRDGSIVFTSTRDGDLELYRMDADGGNLLRLTQEPGYDGGAFFSPDCSRIVWRASRPQGEALAEYQRLLAEHKVRPSRMELWVANADGTEARQITYLGAASFAPYFHPSGDRILFSSNLADPDGREFDIWAINADGSGLERITTAPGFDGFPIFSPDGSRLAFSSNRNQGKPGETNVFVARWLEGKAEVVEGPADRFARDVAWLADDAREGRGVGSEGIEAAARYLEERFRALGLAPAGVEGTFRQAFEVAVEVRALAESGLVADGERFAADGQRFVPLAFSPERAAASAPVVFAGHGVTAPDLGHDDYAGVDVAGKIVLVRRFVPAGEAFAERENERRYGDLRYKAWNAREHGAVGLLVVDLPAVAEGEELPEEAPLPKLRVDDKGDAGIPAAAVSREVAARLLADPSAEVELAVALEVVRTPTHNVAARLAAPEARRRPGVLVIGAHYDHLGYGGASSLVPDERVVHNGADDNASGTAALLEVARELAARRAELDRDVVFVAFSGEEMGVLGSTAFTREPPAGLRMDEVVTMLNMDMVGRLRGNRLAILGSESAAEWGALLPPLCERLGLRCSLSGDGYGPSDQTPFYAAGAPVLHFFTGAHDDYHRPSDDAATIYAAGGARVALLVAETALAVAGGEKGPTYQAVPPPAPQGDVRSYGASLGTVPDFSGAGDGRPGVLLSGVRPGSPAEVAGIQKGDRLVRLAGREIRDLNDFTFVLRGAKPGQKTIAVVERLGQRLELEVTFGEARRAMR